MKRRALVGIVAIAAMVFALDRLFPPPRLDADTPALVVLARDGTPLRAFPDREHVWRHPVTLDEVSPLYREALIAYEDRTFPWHPGVNPFALVRAAAQRLRHGHVVSGGSTLTMQVARMLEPIPRTSAGKVKQVVRALQLELRYSKQEILTHYLNHAPMGGVLEGVEAASRAYLGKSAKRLTHAEGALLAALPQAPSLLRPDRHPARARASRDKVLRRLTARWGEATVGDALREPIYAHTLRQPLAAPLLAERIRRSANGRVPDPHHHPGASRHPSSFEEGSAWFRVSRRPSVDKEGRTPARVVTTIDAAAQHTLELLLLDHAAQLPARVSLAALVIDNATLEVLAYAGSADFRDAERFSHVDMVRAPRSPGSTLKPFLYAFALDEGLIHSESLLADVPQSFGGYQPGNFQQSFHGPVSVSEALVRSLNVPAVEVLDHLGPTRFVSQLRRGGLALALPRGAEPNLSVILGGGGVTLEQLTAAYTAFARGGLAGKPRFLPTDPVVERRMMSAGAAFIVRDILESGGPVGRAVNTAPTMTQRIAWKTGTSFGFRDAWAVGVGDRYTIGVWVGRPDGTPNPGFFGANTAAPLLVDIFAGLAAPTPLAARPQPPEVAQARICWPLGLRASAETEHLCQVQRTAWLLNDTAPPTFADRLQSAEPRRTYLVRVADGLRAEHDCARGDLLRVEAARWPSNLEPWLEPSIRRKALPPPWGQDCSERTSLASGLKIMGANDGEVLHRAGDAAPLVRLELRGHAGSAHWMINGRLVARTAGGERYDHRFEAPGRYEITAFNDAGRYDRISVSVR